MKHQTPSEFYTSPVNVELIGAGATGSQILAGLVRLHLGTSARDACPMLGS